MTKIPKALRDELALDPYYARCAREGLFGHECEGRVTWEHALIYAGRQVQLRFAIIPLCAKAHAVNEFQDGGEANKRMHEWIALNRANDDELLAMAKVRDYFWYRGWLNTYFGMVYHEPVLQEAIRYS